MLIALFEQKFMSNIGSFLRTKGLGAYLKITLAGFRTLSGFSKDLNGNLILRFDKTCPHFT